MVSSSLRAFSLFVLLMVVAVPAAHARTVWEDDDSYVRIESSDKGAAPNEHPARLAVDDVADMLGALQVTRRKATQPIPLFSPEELAVIAPQITRALAEAGPDEDVVFRSRGAHTETLFGVGRQLFVSEGILFISDGRMNVIFSRLQEDARKRNLYGQRDEDFYSAPDPSRKRENSFRKASLRPGPGVALQASRNGGLREDWVVIEPDAQAYAATAPAPADAAPVAPPPATAAPSSPAPRAGGDDYVPLEERLRRLKLLRDEGLITEELYQEKMRELLMEL